MGEVGRSGLPNVMGLVRDDDYKSLEFPLAARTYKNMTMHPTVSSAITTILDSVRQLDWVVEDTEGVPEDRKEFIKSCMDDMDRPWKEYINEFLSIIVHGFSLNEKVWKKRKSGKSNHKDGLIGWKRLPTRNQASIKRWVWSEDGTELLGAIQDLAQVKGGATRYNATEPLRGLPIKKMLHFRHNPQLDNPEGISPLKGAYIPWQYLTTLEEYQAIGVSRDLGGMPVVRLPPDYMSDKADEGKKAVYEYMKTVVRNITANEQAGLVLPKFVDPDTKQDVFDFELVGVSGGKQYDTNAIIERYEHKVLMVFLADVLILGHGGGGSLSLAEEKSSLLSLKVRSLLDQVISVINEDLIPHTFEMNGWDTTVTPKITYKGMDEDSLDSISKFIQRTVTAGAMEVDRPLSNKLRDLIEMPPVDETNPITVMNPNNNSEAGSGMKEGLPSGNGKASGNNSATNSDNAE